MTSRAQAELHKSEFETLEDDVLLSKVGESFDRFVALTMEYSVVLVALVEHVRFLTGSSDIVDKDGLPQPLRDYELNCSG
jgi:hypothetical protein